METEPQESLDLTIDTGCDGLLPTALEIGVRAVVTPDAGAGLKLYATPETASTVVFQAAAGSSLILVGGPVCNEEHRWWRAQLTGGEYAWVADGDASTPWLEPQN